MSFVRLMLSKILRVNHVASCTTLRLLTPSHLKLTSINLINCRAITKGIKDKLDYSKYPELDEKDLEEQFIHGSGPGGQAVNKAHNCVLLKHKPSGIIVKCHEHRFGEHNRRLARELLTSKLDDYLNKEDSISQQIKRIQEDKNRRNQSKKQKIRQLKKDFKERQEIELNNKINDN